MIESLKKKILKYNNFSIFILLFFLAVSTYTLTYCIMHEKLNEEIKNIKTTYINNQKMLMKNQINNLINFIKTIKNDKMKEMLYELKKTNFLLSDIINKLPANGWKTVLNEYSETYPLIHITLSDINANPLFTHLKDYNKTKRLKLIKKLLLKHKNDIFFVHKTSLGKKITFQHLIDGKYLLTTCLYQKEIDDIIKKTVIKVISNIRFGAKNNGYISIAEILNYKGGKRFAKVVALPVKPAMVGKFLDDDKKDAKGKKYRKEYLKIANSTGEGFVEYYFYKYSNKIIRPKISYVKLYKPFNWLIFTSVFLDDINEIIDKKIIIFNREIKKIFTSYTILFLIIILIAVLITRYENKILKEIIDQYEKQINYQNIQLKSQNINLQHEVHKKTKQLIENMFKDSLTNLPNREKLLNDIKDNYIAIINIDDFKEINDFFGIKEGDRIIREFARFLNKITPTYKLSGDEYAVIGKTPAKLKHIASEITDKLKNKIFKIDNQDIKLSVSIGIGKTISEADTALKYSKQHTKEIIVYNKNLPILKEYENNLKWKKIINDAIENDGIIPYVQAIVDNKTKKSYKHECLIRLKHNDKIYTPYYFLDIAKRTHQYETLQTIMIKKCFEKFSTKDYKFSINLSTTDLKNRQFLDFLITNIEKYKVAHKLTIELLEDEELVKDEKIHKNIMKLSKMGISIAIDDFGSGYSNFVYLIKKLPINTLKIDGTLVKDILRDEKLYKLLQKIVEIAKTFNFETIAEFVENEKLYKKLKELDIDASQGYFFSKPFNMEELK